MTTTGTTNLDILELSVPSIEADEIHSGAAAVGHVLTADGVGGASWQEVSAGLPAASQAEQEAGESDEVACVPAHEPLRKIGDGWALGTGGNARGSAAVDLQVGRSNATQVASGAYSTVGGGNENTASGDKSTVGGGCGNTASGSRSTVGGGYRSTASSDRATVAGGAYNSASGAYSAIGGGYKNTASNVYSAVGGGYGNTASGSRSTVGGGYRNTASSDRATVAGGYENIADGVSSAILGGTGNDTNGLIAAMIAGTGITAVLENAMHCNRLVVTQIPTSASGLPSGAVWSDGGTLKIVVEQFPE